MAWVIIIMLIIAFAEVPALFHKKMIRELLGFSFLWVVAFIYASLAALKLPLPTITETLKYIYDVVNYYPQ